MAGLPCTPLWVLGRLKAAYLCQHVECAALDMRSVIICSFRCCTACGINICYLVSDQDHIEHDDTILAAAVHSGHPCIT